MNELDAHIYYVTGDVALFAPKDATPKALNKTTREECREVPVERGVGGGIGEFTMSLAISLS